MKASSTVQQRPLARKIVIDLSIMTAIGVLLAFIGPFGSFAEPLVYRLVSWVSFAWIGYAIYSPMNWVVDKLQTALDLPRPLLWVFAVAAATAPMTAIVWSFGFLPGPVPVPSLEQALTSYFYVFLVGGGVTAFFYALEARGKHGGAAAETENRASPYTAKNAEPGTANESTSPSPLPSVDINPLLADLPPELGSDVIALEMEDHYVRVHTGLGSELVLMRLRDAMTHVSDIEGMQVHRSWWVARAAVEDVQRNGRNVSLALPRGIAAPVSRAKVSELRSAGWI